MRQIPMTPAGRNYHRFLWVVAVAAVVGLADAARILFWDGVAAVMDSPVRTTPGIHLKTFVQLLAWALLGWAAYLGLRLRRFPPTWTVLAVPVVVWVILLI